MKHESDTDEVILDDGKRTLPVRPIPREEPVTPLPAPPALPRTRSSGELLLDLRAPSNAPPDPVVSRIDAWGEVFVAKIDEIGKTAKRADETSGRASKDNEDQNAAIGLIRATQTEHGRKLDAIERENALGVQLASGISAGVAQLTSKWPAAVQAVATAFVTAALAAAVAWARGKGWLP